MHLLPQTQLQNGKYRIIEKIGQGGFGIVYRAYNNDLNSIVCIKEFFFSDLCERQIDSLKITVVSNAKEKLQLVDALRRKFLKESQRLAQFSNPNIIKVLDSFDENNTSYFVMEYIDGISLEAYLVENGVLSEIHCKKIMIPIIKALGHIHNNGLLHLDIKPANIMFRNDGTPIIIDFGISKCFDIDGGHTTTAPVGISKGYAPLEQYIGRVSDFSMATDLYSICATLYHMVTGVKPPEPLIIMQKGINPPKKINPNISTSFSRLILKGLSLNKEDRLQNVDLLLTEMFSNQLQNDVKVKNQVVNRVAVVKDEYETKQISQKLQKNTFEKFGTVTDVDGNVYKTVKIGNQIWMAENLRTTHYNDGSSIPLVTSSQDWSKLSTPAYWSYDYGNTAKNFYRFGFKGFHAIRSIYGLLYNWHAINVAKLAPKGWHVPSKNEWDRLSKSLGGDEIAGGRLKDAGTKYWESPNLGATNDSFFTALPGGLRGGGDGELWNVFRWGFWWSSTLNHNEKPLTRYLYFDDKAFKFTSNDKTCGCSVRCVKD